MIPKPLPSYNEILGRGSRHQYRNLKRDWEQITGICAAAAGLHGMRLQGPLGLVVTRYGVRAIDPDNLIVKPLVDGLRHAHVIVEDKPAVIAWVQQVSRKCKLREQRTEVLAVLIN